MLTTHNNLHKNMSFDLSDPSVAVNRINNCIPAIKTWIIQNRLMAPKQNFHFEHPPL